jgi:hypothetical protein
LPVCLGICLGCLLTCLPSFFLLFPFTLVGSMLFNCTNPL